MKKRIKSIKNLQKSCPSIKSNILFYLAGFLAIFIPLYPKLPLVDILPGYIVRLRLEDIFILIIFFIFLKTAFLQKIKLHKNPLFWPISIYLLVGFLSVLSGVFITNTIPIDRLHIAKAFLHLIRRAE